MTWAIFSDEHIRAIAEIIQSGSERVTAIVGGALLDDTLRRTLAERLRNDKDIARKLLKVNAPLGNTVPKIDLLYMLQAFEKPVRNALYGLSNARNFYAHNLDASFNSQKKEMVDAMKLLALHEDRKVYPHHIYEGDADIPIETIKNNRDRFIVNLKLCLSSPGPALPAVFRYSAPGYLNNRWRPPLPVACSRVMGKGPCWASRAAKAASPPWSGSTSRTSTPVGSPVGMIRFA